MGFNSSYQMLAIKHCIMYLFIKKIKLNVTSLVFADKLILIVEQNDVYC